MDKVLTRNLLLEELDLIEVKLVLMSAKRKVKRHEKPIGLSRYNSCYQANPEGVKEKEEIIIVTE